MYRKWTVFEIQYRYVYIAVRQVVTDLRNMWARDWGDFQGIILYETLVQSVAESLRT